MTAALTVGTAPSRYRARHLFLPVAGIAVVAGFTLAIMLGPISITLRDITGALMQALSLRLGDAVDPMLRSVIIDLRLPRALAALAIGALLATGGVTMQGLFRNPLADPGLIGVSSGAALAVASFIVFGAHLPGLSAGLRYFALPGVAFLGGLVVVLLIQRLAAQDGRTDVNTMLLAGIALTAIVMAGIGLLTFISDDNQLRSLTFWTLGSLGGVGWMAVAILAPAAVIVLAISLRFAPTLDALMLGEREAYSLGFEVERAKRLMIFTVAAGVGAAVAFTGLIGFIGIIAPHLVRLILGSAHRQLLIGAALIGGLLLVLGDTICRIVAAPAELPIGIVTSLVGAPFFLALLLRRRREGR